MLMFIDTEFSDFENPSLISIALVSECGQHVFHADISDWNMRGSPASGFVKEHVLPHLNALTDDVGTAYYIAHKVYDFIAGIDEEVIIAADYYVDWALLCNLFMNVEEWMPKNLKKRYINIWSVMSNPAFEEIELNFYNQPNRVRHNALDDAECNRLGWLALDEIQKKEILSTV